jgi:multimeric flavodoxin WrbA
MSKNIKVAVVYHSGYGHTEVIANAIKSGAEKESATANSIKVDNTGNIQESDWKVLNDADAIVFGAPTYMGSVSGPFKMFMDATSKAWFKQDWKDKIAGGFTNSHSMSGDKLSSLQQLVTLACQHGMIWVSVGLMPASGEVSHQRDENSLNRLGSSMGVMAQSENAPADVTPPQGDIKTAILYGARIVEIAKKLKA